MALGNANSSAQARGKSRPIMVKRRKEVVAARDARTITATLIAGVSGSAACSVAGAATFDQTYYTISFTGGTGAYLPDVGSKVYTRKRINDKYALTEGAYLFKVSSSNYYLSIGSDLTVTARALCR